MQNFIQPGEVIQMAAPYDRLAGQGALVGSRFGVAVNDVLSGVTNEFRVEGVLSIAATSAQAWTDGAPVYWDDTNKRADNTVVGPCIGTAQGAKANPSSTGYVLLNDCLARPPAAAQVNTAAAAAATAGGATPTAAQVDTGIATAVAPLVVTINALLVKLRAAGIILP